MEKAASGARWGRGADVEDFETPDASKCPKCGTSKSQGGEFELRVAPCGHRLCLDCVKRLFAGRGNAKCSVETCAINTTESQWEPQVFDGSFVHKEVRIRKRELGDFNLTRRDFASDLEFNEYLEKIETFAYNLAHGVDLERTRAEIEQTRSVFGEKMRRNAETARNAAIERRLREEHERKSLLEKQRVAILKKLMERQQAEERKEALRVALRNAKDPQAVLLDAAHARKREREENQRAAEQMLLQSMPAAGPSALEVEDEGPLVEVVSESTFEQFVYQRPVYPMHGPCVPASPLIEEQRTHTFLVLERFPHSLPPMLTAGGFSPLVATKRALFEAYQGLFD